MQNLKRNLIQKKIQFKSKNLKIKKKFEYK
jgi:hypothetical protein